MSPSPTKELEQQVATLREENERLRALINVPHDVEFFEAARLEAAHQRKRWSRSDAIKASIDWFWVATYLAAKSSFTMEQHPDEHYMNDICERMQTFAGNAIRAARGKVKDASDNSDTKLRHRVTAVAALAANWHATLPREATHAPQS